jgi:hypothetical protein
MDYISESGLYVSVMDYVFEFRLYHCMFQLWAIIIYGLYYRVLVHGVFWPVHLGCAKLGRSIYKPAGQPMPDGHSKPGGCGCGCEISPVGVGAISDLTLFHRRSGFWFTRPKPDPLPSLLSTHNAPFLVSPRTSLPQGESVTPLREGPPAELAGPSPLCSVNRRRGPASGPSCRSARGGPAISCSCFFRSSQC